MPLFRAGQKLVYFCHVPKCGGTAISRYIKARFGHVAFLDWGYLSARDPWNRTSPQHVSADDLHRLFPVGFFDEMFAVIRHPVSRMVSEYHYQRDLLGVIPQNQMFSEWLTESAAEYSKSRWVSDNHFRPMCEMVPDGAKVFKLESGLDVIVAYLDQIAGDHCGERSIERSHHRPESIDAVIPSRKDLEFISTFYSRDFDRFGYERPLTV